MLSDPTYLALSSTVSVPGTKSNYGYSARAHPFRTSLPLPTFITASPSSQSPFDTQSVPYPRSVRSLIPSMMSSSIGGFTLPTSVGVVSLQTQSTPSTETRPTTSEVSAAVSSTSAELTPSGVTTTSLPMPLSTQVSTSSFTLPTTSTAQPLSPTSQHWFSSPSLRPSSSLPITSSEPSFTFQTSSVDETTTVLIQTTASPSSVQLTASTSTIISLVPASGVTITSLVTSSEVLSTETATAFGRHAPPSAGAIVGIVLGIVGALGFAVLWLYCARRRHRQLVQEAAFIPPRNYAPHPLDDEVPDAGELGYGGNPVHGTVTTATTRSGPPIEERYAGILAALHSTEGFGSGHIEGSTGGVYGSHRDSATDEHEDLARASSPTLPMYSLSPDDLPYPFALSPPPPVPSPSHHQVTQPVPPPSAYHTSYRRSSPGPDAGAWFGGYSVAPSCNSHYARSQTLGSGSRSGSIDALTRTHTGSEEPLLGMRKPSVEIFQSVAPAGGVSPTTTLDPLSNRLGLGSAFGSSEGSMCAPSAMSSTLHRDVSGSYDARSTYYSGSYGHTRSGTPSSFDVLRSVSSQGALSSSYSHGRGQSQGFRFSFNRPGSESSGSSGKKRGSGRHTFGVPPSSFRAWKDWGSGSTSAISHKEKAEEKQSLRENDRRKSTRSTTSGSSLGSVDEKQEKPNTPVGVRAILDLLRRAGHTPSPRSSVRDLPSPTIHNSSSVDPEKGEGKTSVDRVTPPPPPPPIHVQAATPQYRRRYSFILSNPDPHPPSPNSGTDALAPTTDVPHRLEILPNPHDALPPRTLDGNGGVSSGAGDIYPEPSLPILSAPSPVPTEESRLVEGLLHPRLRLPGRSDASLLDFEDYSRPIGGVVKNRMYSTTTFGTQDSEMITPSGGTPVQGLQETEAEMETSPVVYEERDHAEDTPVDVFGASTIRTPRESWFVDDVSHVSARQSPVGG